MVIIKSLSTIIGAIALLFGIFIFIFGGTSNFQYRRCVPQVTLTSTNEATMYSKPPSYIAYMKIPKENYFLCLANSEEADGINLCEQSEEYPEYSSPIIEAFPVDSTFKLTGKVKVRKPLVKHISFHAYNQYIFEGQVNNGEKNMWAHSTTLAQFQSGEFNYANNDRALKQLGYIEKVRASGTELIFTEQTWTCPRYWR